MMISRPLKSADRGAALVEMVIITPLLLIMLIGLMEVGRYGDYLIKVGNAAHAGAEYGAQSAATAGDATGMQNAALADAQNMPSVSVSPAPSAYCACSATPTTTFTCSATVTSPCTPSTTNHELMYVSVTVNGSLSSLTNFYLLPASLRSITVSQTAIMQVAQ